MVGPKNWGRKKKGRGRERKKWKNLRAFKKKGRKLWGKSSRALEKKGR